MKNSRVPVNEANEKSLVISQKPIEPDHPLLSFLDEEDVDGLAISRFESEGGLILTEDARPQDLSDHGWLCCQCNPAKRPRKRD